MQIVVLCHDVQSLPKAYHIPCPSFLPLPSECQFPIFSSPSIEKLWMFATVIFCHHLGVPILLCQHLAEKNGGRMLMLMFWRKQGGILDNTPISSHFSPNYLSRCQEIYFYFLPSLLLVSPEIARHQTWYRPPGERNLRDFILTSLAFSMLLKKLWIVIKRPTCCQVLVRIVFVVSCQTASLNANEQSMAHILFLMDYAVAFCGQQKGNSRPI